MDVKAVKKGTISARIIRADGTIEDLGIIAKAKKPNIFKRFKEMVKWLLY
jgi:hypothetical protein